MPRYLGGIERLLPQFARALRDYGYKVAFITFDHGQNQEETVDGITICKCFAPHEGIRGIRFFYPRLTKLWSAMKQADAKVYIQMGGGAETGCSQFCSQRIGSPKRTFVYLVASDSDCDKRLRTQRFNPDHFIYKHGLKRADVVISQTYRQSEFLQKAAKIPSAVIPMPYLKRKNSPVETSFTSNGSIPQSVLWVGRIVEVKRFEWLLDIAEFLPHIKFDVAGSPNKHSSYYQNLEKRSLSITNITLHGRISDEKLSEFYKNAGLLLCTSSLEGFPTTFLEAWSIGLPVVTSFDPDDVVANMEIGLVANTVQGLVAKIKKILSSKDLYRSLAYNSKTFFDKNYTPEALIPKFQKAMILRELSNK